MLYDNVAINLDCEHLEFYDNVAINLDWEHLEL